MVLPFLGVSFWLCLTQACHRPPKFLWKVTHSLEQSALVELGRVGVQPCQVGLRHRQKPGLLHQATGSLDPGTNGPVFLLTCEVDSAGLYGRQVLTSPFSYLSPVYGCNIVQA